MKIVLIGMPSSGKSLIGIELANKLNKRFIDTDSVVESLAKMDITNIFKNYGEDEFRRLETIAMKQALKYDAVIATGGGAILRAENFIEVGDAKIIYLKRPLRYLVTGGKRPLSKTKKSLEELYKIRKPLYEKYADIVIDNSGYERDRVIDDILSKLNNV